MFVTDFKRLLRRGNVGTVDIVETVDETRRFLLGGSGVPSFSFSHSKNTCERTFLDGESSAGIFNVFKEDGNRKQNKKLYLQILPGLWVEEWDHARAAVVASSGAELCLFFSSRQEHPAGRWSHRFQNKENCAFFARL